jgi:hypothetical protein
MYAGLGQKLSGWGAMIGQSTSIRGKLSTDQKNILAHLGRFSILHLDKACQALQN